MIEVHHPRVVNDLAVNAWLAGLIRPDEFNIRTSPRLTTLANNFLIGGVIGPGSAAHFFAMSVIPFALFLISFVFVLVVTGTSGGVIAFFAALCTSTIALLVELPRFLVTITP